MTAEPQDYCQGCDQNKPRSFMRFTDEAFVDYNGDGIPDPPYLCEVCRKPDQRAYLQWKIDDITARVEHYRAQGNTAKVEMLTERLKRTRQRLGETNDTHRD